MRVQNIISLIIIVLTFATALFLYPSMPEQMPMHWNSEGQVDNYGHKALALFIMPGVALLMFLVLLAIPKMAVHKHNIKQVEPKLATFILLFILLFTAIYSAMIGIVKGMNIDMGKVVLIAIAVIFFYTAYMIKDIKKNFFIGIRTPWTLSSDKVWKKTHMLGSKFFVAFAIIFIIGSFLSSPLNVWFILGPVLLGVTYLVLYSYLEFRKLKK